MPQTALARLERGKTMIWNSKLGTQGEVAKTYFAAAAERAKTAQCEGCRRTFLEAHMGALWGSQGGRKTGRTRSVRMLARHNKSLVAVPGP